MNPAHRTQPFRWNLQKAEQLGALPQEGAEAYPEFLADLRTCAARVLAVSDHTPLVFVGRSPESLYDYLQGISQGNSLADKLTLLNLSIGGWSVQSLQREVPGALHALEVQLEDLGLTPRQLMARSGPITFVDLVFGGSTFLTLYRVLMHLGKRDGLSLRALSEKIRFIGIVEALKTSPNTWRWQQKVKWKDLPIPEVKNVSVPYRLWHFLGDAQHKVARWNPPGVWTDPEMQKPPRESWSLQALSFARKLYEVGCSREEKHLLAREMVQLTGMQQSWYRSLVLQLRGKA